MTSEHRRVDDNGLLKAVKYWTLITSVLALTFSLGISSRTISNLEVKIDHESTVNDRQEKQIAALEEATKEIVEMRHDIKELLRRVR